MDDSYTFFGESDTAESRTHAICKRTHKDRIVFFDLETGGLDPLRHPVIQFAGVALEDWKEIESLELKIRFRLDAADPEALAMNSYDAEIWAREAIDSRDAVFAIGSFLRRHSTVPMASKTGVSWKSCQLAGHNAHKFDREFLRVLFDSQKKFCPGGFIVLDTLQLAAWWRKMRPDARPANLKLGTLCEYFEIEFDKAHDALEDVRATVEVAKRLRKCLR